jgi:hypothetical protein
VKELRFTFECKRTWESLEETDDGRVRRCDECNRTVHLALGVSDAARHAAARRCVAWVREEEVAPRRAARTVTIGVLGASDDGWPVVGWVVDERGDTLRLADRNPIGDDTEIVRAVGGFELRRRGEPPLGLVDGDRLEIDGRSLVFKTTV